MADNTIKKYQTFYEPELNQTFVSEITVDSATQSGFDDVVSAYNSLTQYLQGYQEVPEHIAPSAYSMMGASFVMNDVFDHYSQEATLLTHVTVFISSSLSLLGEIIDIPLHVEVSFADGSSAILNIVSILPNGDIELELASAKDVDNNTISTEASGYTDGLYRFTAGGESAIQEFMAAASRYGVGVCRQGSCFSGETEVDMNCAWVGDVYTCTVTGKKETVIPN
ncbi:hypothetical protein [Idiomarina sp. A28L]|uniref:hypothetical protein n=1 Tax=Idiomarina sp. A28L TaxID=1036674 RepID=UPI001111EFF4|nr:hypothetical protein [Idiomarina sp. A28L]